jgi:hypothetical protein
MRREQIALLTAAVLGLGIFSGNVAAQDATVRTETRITATAGGPSLPAGIQKSTKDDSEDIRDTLGEATEAAFTKAGFDDLVERFVDADRNRLNKFANDNKEKFAQLDAKIEQLRNDFKAKYGKDLDIDHKVVFGNAFNGFAIAQGEISNPALLSNWPVENKAGLSTSGTRTEVKTDAAKDTNIVKDVAGDVKRGVQKVTGGDANLNKGRNVAVVLFPASHGMPEVLVSMIHELPDTWKIDVPDNIDGQRLHDSLMKHLSMFGQDRDKWPADVNEASRMLSHHVLAAVYGLEEMPR